MDQEQLHIGANGTKDGHNSKSKENLPMKATSTLGEGISRRTFTIIHHSALSSGAYPGSKAID
jgi:hypothetical protein